MRSVLVATALAALVLVSLSAPALAADPGVRASVATGDEPADMGIASLVGPQIGAVGPPTAFKVGVQFWHTLYARFAFQAGAAMSFGGETTWVSSHPDTPDARYDSTVGGELQAGVRWILFSLDEAPFETYLRGAIGIDLTGGEEFIGYAFGPSAAIGLSYPLMTGLDLVADAEIGMGYGQYKAQGGLFALTFDLLVGAQIAF